MIKNKQDIENLFNQKFAQDRKKFIKNWLVKWDYQSKQAKRRLPTINGEPSDFFKYKGVNDLADWINWLKEPCPNFLGEDYINDLVRDSETIDKKVFSKLELKIDWEVYKKNVAIRNAHDFIFPNLLLLSTNSKIKNILDFGAGYGRQANLWTSKTDQFTYVGMEAVPRSYCLQNIYYNYLGKEVIDYVETDNFNIEFSQNKIYHLPTWRYDLLPTSSFDIVMCVQVLPELNSTLVKKMISEFNRVLKDGAILYINDHGEKWKPGSFLNIDNFITKNGFVLEFKPHVVDGEDLHGIPRIYRKINPKVIESQSASGKRKLRQHLENIDALVGGRLNKLSKAVRKFRQK